MARAGLLWRFPGADAGAVVRRRGRVFLYRSLFWARAPRSLPRIAFLAALHVLVSPRKHLAPAHQYVVSVDVWPRARAGVGPKKVPELLLPVWRGRGSDRNRGEAYADGLGPTAVGCAHGWRLRSDLRHLDRECDFVSGPARLAFSAARGHSHAALRCGHGGDRIFHDAGLRRRQRGARVPSGWNACRLSVFAARLVFLRRAQFGFRLAVPPQSQALPGVHG